MMSYLKESFAVWPLKLLRICLLLGFLLDSEWELHVSTILSDFSGIRGLVSLLSRSCLFAVLAE